MNPVTLQSLEQRVLMLTPTGRDASLCRAVLHEAGIEATVCRDLSDAVRESLRGAAAILLTEEALLEEGTEELSLALQNQPAWSDLPILMLVRGGTESPLAEQAMHTLGNVMLLERPIGTRTLVSAVRTALRARNRQYQIRENLIEHERAETALRESDERLHLALRGAHAGIWSMDPHTGESFWSDEFYSVHGLRRDQVTPTFQNWLNCIYEQDRQEICRAIENVLERRRQNFHFAFRIEHAEYGIRWIDSLGRVSYGTNGFAVRMTGINIDVTERKRAEEDLRVLNETLEQRVSQRTQKLLRYQTRLRDMASELTLAEQRERRRLAVELHDYLAQLLVVSRMKVGRLRKRAQGEPFEGMLQELDGLLDESLTYTRTLIAELSPTILYDAGLVAAVNWLAQQMARHDLKVVVELRGPISNPPEDQAVLIFQTIRELLFNVVKHAEINEASVILSQEKGRLVVLVRDGGKGFEPSSEYESNGNGKYGLLNISERIEALGGEFSLHSTPGKGTEARLSVPLDHCSLPEITDQIPLERVSPSQPSRARGSRRVLRILLADDHAMVREGLRSVIESYSDLLVVGEASNGEDALRQARELRPDAVVMDINMPIMNGIEATRRIKEELPDIQIIGLSVHDDRELGSSMCEAGAKVFLTKGGPSEELYRALSALKEPR